MNKSKARTIPLYIPNPMFEALDSFVGSKRSVFIREAIAEKLARDFGIDVSNVRHGQRTDLVDNPEKLEQLREQAAMMRKHRWKKE